MKYLLILFSLILFTACGDDKLSADAELQHLEATRSAQNAAYESMVQAHDRIMPMMGQVTAAQRAVKEQMGADGTPEDREDLLEAAYEQLEDANDGMMDWMQSMKPLDELRETMDNDEIMKYIREEASSIAEVENDIKTALAQAAQLVGDHSHDGHSHDHGDHSGHNH